MEAAIRTPWHLWVVGPLAAFWNGLGCLDYTMTMRIRSQAYLGEFLTDPQRSAFFNNMPYWAEAVWALGVGGGFLGAVLLLTRSRHAVLVFVLSLIGLIGCTLYEYVLSSPQALEVFREEWKVAFVLMLWLIALALPLYAYQMQRQGILK